MDAHFSPFLFFSSYNANQTREIVMSTQFSFFSLFSFLPPFPNKALILIIIIVVVVVVVLIIIIIIGTILLLWLHEYDKRHLTIYNKLCWHDNFLFLIGIIGKKRGEDRRNERLSRSTFLIYPNWTKMMKKLYKTSATFGGPLWRKFKISILSITKSNLLNFIGLFK